MSEPLKFRLLKASEIEVRVQSIISQGSGFVLLLYKDARCDMAVLDETVGAMNWKREHLRDNANCIVSIWNEKTGQWVGKEDTGTVSNTEAEKGKASDSFKRSCFNWGIGRELYTAPSVLVFDASYIQKKGNEFKIYEKFSVTHVGYDEDRKINQLVIEDSKGKKVFEFPRGAATTQKREEETKFLKYKHRVLEALEQYDIEIVQMVAEELGEAIQNDRGEDYSLGQIVNAIPTRERLDQLGLEVKAKSEAV